MGKAEPAMFDRLPHKLPTREIISLYTSSDPWANFVGWFGRSEWGIDDSAGYHRSRRGASLRGLPRKGDGLAKGNQEGRAGPSPTTLEPTLLTVGMEVAAHLQVEPTAEDNEVFSTIPTTKPMVETLELQSRALIASRTVVEELERVTTVTVPR
ncbi:hypothetical protein ACSQ67_016673 [Phaseolus vulgaris]